MDYRTTFRSFINSHYLSEGIRITIGLTLPALIGAWLHQEAIGITMSLGASCVIMVDNAGPVHHRRNAMLICTLVIFIVALLTGFIAVSTAGTGMLIAVFCFLFPMIGVYGARAGSIGLAALFIMVLNLEERIQGWNVLLNAAYVAFGAIWYTLLSLSLYSFRPFKVTQQALGDCIQSTAEYLLARSAFYNKNPDFDQIYSHLIDKQAEIHEKQNLVRELLFKSRDIVKETTNTGRVLLLIFLDIIDLFERVMSTQPDYRLLHQYFDESGILGKFKSLLLVVSEELNETGIAVKSGRPYSLNERMEIMLRELKDDFDQLRDDKRNASNVEGFIAMRNVLDGLEEIVSRLITIQQYSS
ncbi:MAG: FUSC family membrane protein, partial [Bacteroidota bacterium]|nr:FUSC family membrane protein [Bacteroidota bacterium]